MMGARGYKDQRVTVVGAGPNGLTAAALLSEAGVGVTLIEGAETIGGGCRSSELTLPGYLHDQCSAAHPMGASSPAFNTLGLEGMGLEWSHARLVVAHPLSGGGGTALSRDLGETKELLGPGGGSYVELMEPLVEEWGALVEGILGKVYAPKHPITMMKFGRYGLRSARGLAEGRLAGEGARAIFAGAAAHAMVGLESAGTAAFGLALCAAAHAVGWPFAKGGSRAITDTLAKIVTQNGGKIVLGEQVDAPSDLPDEDIALFTFTPRQLMEFGAVELNGLYRRRIGRFVHGHGVFKVDWALSEPIPWEFEPCRHAGTVHVGGSLDEISACARAIARGAHPEHPFVIVTQPTLADPSRAPEGRHVGWAYCHVPNGSTEDMTERLEKQIERFAPGFRETILSRHTRSAAEMELYNPCYIGGDIGGGAQTLAQTLFRPMASFRPQKVQTSDAGHHWYICSSSTPPGGGVHGMCGYHAAQTVLKELNG